MKASIVDLRYKMKEVLAAIDRNETVEVYYRGKLKGVLTPAKQQRKLELSKHPAFGMLKNDPRSVKEIMNELRAPRYAAL
jgi:antitoxin (DNA-binding transcriptional repressor) of toxin-antitoxin stability system